MTDMDIEKEYPELREFFEQDKKAKAMAEEGKKLRNGDSGTATIKLEKDGSMTVQNEFVEHVPVTA